MFSCRLEGGVGEESLIYLACICIFRRQLEDIGTKTTPINDSIHFSFPYWNADDITEMVQRKHMSIATKSEIQNSFGFTGFVNQFEGTI